MNCHERNMLELVGEAFGEHVEGSLATLVGSGGESGRSSTTSQATADIDNFGILGFVQHRKEGLRSHQNTRNVGMLDEVKLVRVTA